MKNLVTAIAVGVMYAGLISCNNTDGIDAAQSKFAVCDDGVKVHYKTSGEGDLAVVFVHGFGCDLRTWTKQFHALAGEDSLKQVYIDLPGFGKSDRPDVDYTLSYFAESVARVLETEGVNKAVLVGHSLGTPICRQVAFEYPQLVAGIFDIDGVYCLFPQINENSTDADREASAQYERAVNAFAARFCGDSVAENIRNFAASLSGPNTPAEVAEYALENMPNVDAKVACSTMSNLIDRKWWTGQWLDVPTVVICTKNSGIDPDNGKKMQALYSNIDYVELDDCGHFIHMEQPELVNNKLRELLAYARSRSINRIDVNGVNLLYEVAGEGKPVLLFHGNGGSHEAVETTAGQLVRKGYKVYAVDSRGQGANEPLNEYHYADMAEDMYQFCKKLNIEKPAVYGWSDGGIVALMLEVLHPGTTSLMAISGANVHPRGVVNFEQFRADILAQNNPLSMMMVFEPNITDSQLQGVNVPVLVCAGSADLIVEEHTRHMAKMLPKAELMIIEGEDHGSYIWHNPMMGEIFIEYLLRHGYTSK